MTNFLLFMDKICYNEVSVTIQIFWLEGNEQIHSVHNTGKTCYEKEYTATFYKRGMSKVF